MIERFTAPEPTPALDSMWLSVTTADDLVAPPLFLAECTSVLSVETLFKRIEAERARAVIAEVLQFGIRIVTRTDIYPRAYDMARALGWGKAYDALYLATAELEGAELLTLDGGMGEAAGRLGVPCSVVGGSSAAGGS